MAHKTFISYKYSESRGLRDEILRALGDDASYYQGETSDSPDLTDLTTETIKKNLKDMMYDTSVTIVIISPNMTRSKWIDWEIEYTLKEISRDGRTSKTNGVLGVIQKVNDGYGWINTVASGSDGCSISRYDDSKIYEIIQRNRYNQTPKVYACTVCQTVNYLTGSYFSLIKEEDFLSDPSKYIENAFDKSKDLDSYEIVKLV